MLKKNLIANYIGQIWVAVMGLIFVPVYIRYIGIESYGLIGLQSMLQVCFSVFDAGVTPTLGREMARFTAGTISSQSIRDLLRSIEYIAVFIALCISMGTLILADRIANSWLIVDSLPIGEVENSLIIMGPVIGMRFMEGLYRSAIAGLQRQIQLNIISASSATLRWGGAAIILKYWSPSVVAFFTWQLVISLLTLIAYRILTNCIVPPAPRKAMFSISKIAEVKKFASGMAVITLQTVILTQIDKILLTKFLSLKDYGYYSLAATVAGALYTTITPISQAWYPRLCELHSKNNDSIVDAYHNGAQLVTVIAGSCAIVIAIFSRPLLYLWTQDQAMSDRTSPLLTLLVIGNLLNGLYYIPYQLQLAYGWTSLTVRLNLLALLIIVPGIIWSIPYYGAEGPAWVWIALNAVYILIGAQFMYLKILPEEKWKWYYNDIVMPLGGALIAGLAIKSFWPAINTSLSYSLQISSAAILTLSLSAFLAKGTRNGVKALYQRS